MNELHQRVARLETQRDADHQLLSEIAGDVRALRSYVDTQSGRAALGVLAWSAAMVALGAFMKYLVSRL